MAKQLQIIARTNKSGFELLTIHNSQTLVLPDDDSAPDCDIALTLHSEAQEIIDVLYDALSAVLDSKEIVNDDPLVTKIIAAVAKAGGEAA